MTEHQISCQQTGTTADLSASIWRKSSYSGTQGNCVELAANLSGLVAIRDSKHPDAAVLAFSPAQWQGFLRRV